MQAQIEEPNDYKQVACFQSVPCGDVIYTVEATSAHNLVANCVLTHDKICGVKLWGKGLLTVGCGFLAVFVAAGGGPCGPSNLVGLAVMLLGILAVPIGALVFIVGLIKAGY